MAARAQACESLLEVDLVTVVHSDDLARDRHAFFQASGGAPRRQDDRTAFERGVRWIERTASSDERDRRRLGSPTPAPELGECLRSRGEDALGLPGSRRRRAHRP